MQLLVSYMQHRINKEEWFINRRQLMNLLSLRYKSFRMVAKKVRQVLSVAQTSGLINKQTPRF